MTNKEALTAVIGFTVSDSLLEKALADSNLQGATVYSRDNGPAIDSMAVDVLFAAWSTPDVSEGGYSVKFDRNAMQKKIEALAGKCGRTDILTSLKPTVTGKSPW
jgi:hypothetical protein